jgi:Fe2+ or Zn2+ uptake regulation protein
MDVTPARKRRRSKKRDASIGFAESKNHPTAEQIYRALKPDWPALSLGTVYGTSAAS